jgi:acetate kinase
MNAPTSPSQNQRRAARGLHRSSARESRTGSRSDRDFDAGKFVRGDEVHFLGVVWREKSPRRRHGGWRRRRSGNVGPGETFGEMALMSGDPARDLVAETRSRVMLVPLTLFQSHIMAEPRAVQHISRTIGRRFQQVMRDPAKAAAIARKEDVAGLLELKASGPSASSCSTAARRRSNTASSTRSIRRTRAPEHSSASARAARGSCNAARKANSRATCRRALRGGIRGDARGAHGPGAGVIREASRSARGHRVVHGGEKFTSAVLIDDAVLAEIEALSPLAPLHNPVNVAGIREARRVFAAVPHVAVFDTAFHATLPSHAYLYGCRYELLRKKGVRRYGFHGSSHSYVALAAAQFLQAPSARTEDGELPSRQWRVALRDRSRALGGHDHGLHAGRRAHHGHALRRSGFRRARLPRTHRGHDRGAARRTAEQEERPARAVRHFERHARGRKGRGAGTRGADGAEDFCYRVRKYIGAYVAAMGGLDVLIFTAGIGQGSAGVARSRCRACVAWASPRRAAQPRRVRGRRSRAFPPTTHPSPCSSCRPTKSA